MFAEHQLCLPVGANLARGADAVADVAGKEGDEIDEQRIAGRGGQRAVKGEVFLDRGLAELGRRHHCRMRLVQLAQLRLGVAFRGEAGGGDLHPHAQLENPSLGLGCGGAAMDAERPPHARRGDEDAGTLARFDQSLGAEAGDRLADHREADAILRGQLLAGRQLVARVHAARIDRLRQGGGHPVGEAGTRQIVGGHRRSLEGSSAPRGVAATIMITINPGISTLRVCAPEVRR